MEQGPNKDELKEAPFLSKMKGQPTGFQMPEGYFEQLQSQMEAKMKAAQKPAQKGRVVSIFKWASGIAAALLIGFFALPYGGTVETTNAIALADFSEETLANYLVENIEEVEWSELADIVDLNESDVVITNHIDDDQANQYWEDHIDDLDLGELF